MAKKPKITKSGLEIDLTGVEASERRAKRRIPEGVYRAKVDKVGPKKFSTGSRGVEWQFVIIQDGKGKGARFYENNTLIDADGEVMEHTLWSFRGILQALSPKIKIPDSLMKIPFDKLVDRTAAIEVADDEDDEGKVRSTIIDVFTEDLLDEEEDEEDEDEDDDDEEDWDEGEDEDEEDDDFDDDEEEEEDFHDLGIKELRAYARKQGIKTSGKKKKDLIEELEELDEDEDEEDEEDEFDLEEDEL